MAVEGALIALSQPVTTLIEKIASGVGILYEPTRIRKKAIPQADVNKICDTKLKLKERMK